jgi:hypothetical protein
MDQGNEQVESAPQSAQIESKPMNMAATLAICSGGWLVPGLAHILIGRWVRGLIFAACIFLMFGLGLAMHGKLYDLDFDQGLLPLFAFVANRGTSGSRRGNDELAELRLRNDVSLGMRSAELLDRTGRVRHRAG